MRTYFIHDEQSEIGPLTFEELKSRKISRHTQVWFEGLSAWTTAENIPELTSLFTLPPKFNSSSSYNTQPEYTYPQEVETKKSIFTKPYFIGAAVLTIALIGWLVYNNNSQAAELEHIQQVQKQVETSVLKIEEEKQLQEAERKRINEQITKKNKNYRNNWYKYIDVGPNSYRSNSLGGIYGLEINVVNNTEYMLDEVIATITYVKANGDAWKTVEVPIYNVPANSYKTQPVPDVERGISVEVVTTAVISKKMHFCYIPGNWANNSDDPYFCK